jgi:DNA-binding MarR family transcriptional regulator
VVHEGDTARLNAAVAIVVQATARVAALSGRYLPEAGVALRAVAERLYSERRRRDAQFPPDLFGEPAWDLLLALFMAQEDGRELDLTEAYAAAKIDPREGPALVNKLADAGLVLRSRTQRDKRCTSVVLTDHGADRMSDYLMDLI